ncbi:hypothetical protein DTW90_28960 [Neorhizobium sp. P12A]|nr:hypothetical protein DTW90_28960 [Neorhizobium sp. P12A]TCR64496.1 hypothetical protein EV561_1659 [Rhizobium sp. BK376]
MTVRYLWTLERHGHPALIGLDTGEDLISILRSQNLSGVMPADWIFAALHFDAGNAGVAIHDSMLGWTRTAKRLQADQ